MFVLMANDNTILPFIIHVTATWTFWQKYEKVPIQRFLVDLSFLIDAESESDGFFISTLEENILKTKT